MISFVRVLSVIGVLTVSGMLCTAVAQQGNNPLDFNYSTQRVGIDLGLLSCWQTGVYTARCGRFEKGSKLNPIVGFVYDYPLSGSLRFEAFTSYQSRNLYSTYNSRENVVVQTEDNQSVLTNVDFENIGEANFTYLFVMPSIRWNFTKALFVGAGLNAGYLLSATTQYTKNVASKVVSVEGLGLAEVSYPASVSTDPYSKVFPVEDRTDAESFAIDGALYVGAEFKLLKNIPKLKTSLRVVYTLPLTPVFTSPEELKLNTLQILVGFRWNLSSQPE